jgi:uncharacterized protein (TIGR00730 family)
LRFSSIERVSKERRARVVEKNMSKEESQMVSLSDEAAVKQILIDTVFGLWNVVNNLTRIRPARRERYRVTIFGSARVGEDTFAYNEVKRMAQMLTEMGCDIVTGGGPGLMLAANEGAANEGAATAAQQSQDASVGIRVDLPFEQEVNAFVQEAYEHGTFFTRLHHFVLASDAFVVTPGGIGTLLETAMIWQLLQVRHIDNVPLILIGQMWQDLVEWARKSMTQVPIRLASPADIDIAKCVNTADEAIDLLRKHHDIWRNGNE